MAGAWRTVIWGAEDIPWVLYNTCASIVPRVGAVHRPTIPSVLKAGAPVHPRAARSVRSPFHSIRALIPLRRCLREHRDSCGRRSVAGPPLRMNIPFSALHPPPSSSTRPPSPLTPSRHHFCPSGIHYYHVRRDPSPRLPRIVREITNPQATHARAQCSDWRMQGLSRTRGAGSGTAGWIRRDG